MHCCDLAYIFLIKGANFATTYLHNEEVLGETAKGY
jgi:hypothetical protein